MYLFISMYLYIYMDTLVFVSIYGDDLWITELKP